MGDTYLPVRKCMSGRKVRDVSDEPFAPRGHGKYASRQTPRASIKYRSSRSERKSGRRTLLHVCTSSPDKTYRTCKLPGETARCAREGRKHALYNNSKNNATQHANFLHANGLREGPVVYLALLCVHFLVYCLKREYIRLTVAADVFHGRLTL